jgi:hypothetical protein
MARYISGQILPWKRFWVPWDGNFRCGDDGRGFLDDPDGVWGKIVNPQARSIDELLAFRCVILSGHPGIGKTVEIEQAHGRLRQQRPASEELFFFHCRSISGVEMLRCETVAHPRWLHARSAGSEIRLIIDGVDEGLRKVPEFVYALALILRDERLNRLRVALVCRSAEWDVEAGKNLMRLWAEKDRAGVYELCPLRQQDAENAACATGTDNRAFMRAVFRHQVQGLAARPITLQMLLDEFAFAGRFPDTRKELYSRAARRMCREDEDRLRSLRKHYSSFPEGHVYLTVSRIAALLMLSAKSVVLRRDDENPSPVELPWRSIVGGTETTLGESFEVTEHLVEAALETAHFSFRGPHRYGFDHPTFAESLAAEYLRTLPFVQIRQLLCQRFKNRDLVVPQLAEVAAWLALDHDGWRLFLIETQPTILLRTDVSKFTNGEKKLAIGSLLERADREEAYDEQGTSTFYRALRHPGIGDQLRPYIVDRSRNLVVRRIAIEIAGDTGMKQLEPLLWKLIAANDPAYNAITHALFDLAGPRSKNNLLKALHAKFPGDCNKDLAGVALKLLVPKMLPVRSVLAFIEDEHERGHVGSYETALERHLPKAVVVADVPSLLKRMGSWNRCFDALSRLHNLAERGFTLALENLHDAKVRKCAIEMWLQKVRTHAPLPGRSGNDEISKAAGLDNSTRRREFVRAMLNSGLAKADDVLNFSAMLVSHADLEWLLTELPQAPCKHREAWAQVTARCVWGPERDKNRDLLTKTYNLVPELSKYLPTPRKGDINMTLDRLQRAVELRRARMQRKWARERQASSRRELLDQAFKTIKSGKSNGWIGISTYAFIEEGEERNPAYSRSVSRYDIVTAPGWRAMSASERIEATAAARRFLIDHEDKREDLDQYSNYAEAGYLAIRLLRQQIESDHVLREAVRRKWIFSVTDRLNNAEEEHQEQIAFVYRLDPKRVTNRLLLKLRHEDKQNGFALVFREFEKAWCRPLTVALSGIVGTAELQPRTTSAILQFLAERDRPRTVSAVKRLLRGYRGDLSLSPCIRAVVSVALFTLPQDFWDEVWPSLVKADAEMAQQLLLENSWDLSHGELGIFDKLTDHQIGELYLLLMKLFPPETDPQDKLGRAHAVTSRHEMQRLRDGCTGMLVRRATDSSLEELQRLTTHVPPAHRVWLRWSYAEALKNRLRSMWTAGVPFPREILALAQSNAARRVEDEDGLLEAVLSSLGRLQMEMDSDRLPSTRDLWNEADARRHVTPKPKREEELSHLVRRWLNKDLPANTGIIVNCEVKVERFGRGKMDIKVEAVSKDKLAPRRLALIIEVKRCSHPDIATASKTQLANGYLTDQGLTHGIYLVGWYGLGCGQTAKWRSRVDAEHYVEKLADTSSQGAVTVKGFVLDCRLPELVAPSKRKGKAGSNDH